MLWPFEHFAVSSILTLSRSHSPQSGAEQHTRPPSGTLYSSSLIRYILRKALLMYMVTVRNGIGLRQHFGGHWGSLSTAAQMSRSRHSLQKEWQAMFMAFERGGVIKASCT